MSQQGGRGEPAAAEAAGIERILDGEHVLALILRAAYEPQSIQFLTEPTDTLQLGVMNRPRDYQIPPHVHRPAPRQVEYTCEALFVARGRMEVTFYSATREPRGRRELAQGDCVLLMTGGHGFRMLEDCKLIEVKQGPYAGADADKVRFTP